MDEALQHFIVEHEGEETSALLFAADKYPHIDVRKAAMLIEARKKAASKLPNWFAIPGIDYPSSLSLEQCSSQATARYKQRFVPEGGTLCDITGGLGVDCFFMSRKASTAWYVERNPLLCEAAEANFALLGADNITVSCADHPDTSRHYSLLYADPARRSKAGSRIYSIADCEPDITLLKGTLLEICDSLLIKISPMADISRTLEQLPESSEIHIISANNECKEILVLMQKKVAVPSITCCDLTPSGDEKFRFEFTLGDEEKTHPSYATTLSRYLYQPGKAVLKSGAFKLISERFGLDKLAPSTHLYTSDKLSDDFPGNIYSIEAIHEWNKQTINVLSRTTKSAELLSVNFPMDTASLRKKLRIKDGSGTRLIATTFGDRKIVLQVKLLNFASNQNKQL